MKRYPLLFACLLFACLLFANPLAAEPAPESHRFVNQAGSVLSYQVSGEGRMTGSYRSALGCGVGVERELAGWINGSAIVFSVSFGECGSATSWSGHIDERGVISSIWILARGNDASWNAKLTGSSVFTPVEPEDAVKQP